MMKWLILFSLLFFSCSQKEAVVFSDPWYFSSVDKPVFTNGDLKLISAENSYDEITKILGENQYKKAVLTPYLQGVLPVNFFREHSSVEFVILETEGVEGMENVVSWPLKYDTLVAGLIEAIAGEYNKNEGVISLFFYMDNTRRIEMLNQVTAGLDEQGIEYSLCRLEKNDGRNKIRNHMEKTNEVSFAVLLANRFNAFIYELLEGKDVTILTESAEALAAVDSRIKFSVETDKIGFIESAIEGDSEKTAIVLKKY